MQNDLKTTIGEPSSLFLRTNLGLHKRKTHSYELIKKAVFETEYSNSRVKRDSDYALQADRHSKKTCFNPRVYFLKHMSSPNFLD